MSTPSQRPSFTKIPHIDWLPSPAVALVQGASRGIGLEFTKQLLDDPRYQKVFATCRLPEQADALRTLAQDATQRLEVVRLDVTDESSIEAAAAHVSGQVDALHLLINVSGLLHQPGGLQPEKRLEDIQLSWLQQSFAVNAWGPLLVARAFLPLLQHKQPCIVANLSARVGSIDDNRLGGWYAYRASKAAQNMFTKNLSIELRRRNRQILCIALHPGTTDTGLSEPFQRGVPPQKLFSTTYAVSCLLDVLRQRSPDDNGSFYDWAGEPITW